MVHPIVRQTLVWQTLVWQTLVRQTLVWQTLVWQTLVRQALVSRGNKQNMVTMIILGLQSQISDIVTTIMVTIDLL